jgi:transketolase
MYTQDYMVEHFETLETAKFGMHSNRKYVSAIEVSAGSLGHGLPIAVGMALGARRQGKDWRTIVLVGDGEMNEGTNWEAIMSAGHFKLGNLVGIVDRNHLQMTSPTEEGMALEPLDKKLEAFGWDVMEIDGNDMEQVCRAYEALPVRDHTAKRRPVFIIANTVKGKCVDFMENNVNWHGGGIALAQRDQAISCLESAGRRM